MRPTALIPKVQRGAMDCGLVALEMYTGLSPTQIADAAKRAAPHAHRGLWQREFVRLAWALTVKLARLPRPEAWEDEDCGFLLVADRTGGRHWLLWFEGALINPADGMVWRPDVYLATRRVVAAYVEREA